MLIPTRSDGSGPGSGASPGPGLSTDIPVPANYLGDGKADPAVYRPSTGAWYLLNSGTASYAVISWGLSTDTPINKRP